jgi:hypothetical protein
LSILKLAAQWIVGRQLVYVAIQSEDRKHAQICAQGDRGVAVFYVVEGLAGDASAGGQCVYRKSTALSCETKSFAERF